MNEVPHVAEQPTTVTAGEGAADGGIRGPGRPRLNSEQHQRLAEGPSDSPEKRQ